VSIPLESAGPHATAGVDWAKDDHAICIVDEHGDVMDRFTVAHDASGLKRMCRRLLRAGVGGVGIERGDGQSSRRCCARGSRCT